MNIRTTIDAGSLSPELVAAMTAAVRAFLGQETAQSPEPRPGMSAWRLSTRAGAGFGPDARGWRGRD